MRKGAKLGDLAVYETAEGMRFVAPEDATEDELYRAEEAERLARIERYRRTLSDWADARERFRELDKQRTAHADTLLEAGVDPRDVEDS